LTDFRSHNFEESEIMRSARSFVVASLVIVVALSLAFFAKGTALAAPEYPEKVALKTVYLQKPIKGFHQIKVEGDLRGTGSLLLDPNCCEVTEFGETGRCTRIAITKRDVTFKLVRREGGRTLFSIEGAELENPLYLVTPASPRGSFRLVYNDRAPEAPYPVT